MRRALLNRSAAVAAMCLGLLMAAPASARAATYTEESVVSGPIKITSVVSSTMSSLAPDFESGWQIGIEPLEQLDGEIRIGLDLLSDPALAKGMTLEVWQCDVRWVNRQCATGYSTWMSPRALTDGLEITHDITQSHQVGAWDGRSPAWIVLRITTDQTLRRDAAARFKVAVWGDGFSASITDPDGSGSGAGGGNGSLVLTGGQAAPGFWLGVVVMGIGFLLFLIGRRRRHDESDTVIAPAGAEGVLR